MRHDTIQAPDLQHQLQNPSHPHGPLVVDIRSRKQFRKTRIPGSHNIPAGRLISTEFPDRDLVLVGSADRDTSRLIDQLYDQGYSRQIRHLQGGLNQWSAAGLPLESEGALSRRERERPFPWITIAAAASLRLGLQQLSPALVLLSVALLITPGLLSAWLQRHLFRLERRTS